MVLGQRARHHRADRVVNACPFWLTVVAVLIAGCTHDAPPNGPRVLYYRSPMNPEVTSPVPRKDEMGMDYVPVYDDHKATAEGVQLSERTARNLGVTTAPVSWGPLTGELQAPGVVRTNESSVREIRIRVDGWVEELSVHAVGETVRAGRPLLKLYSPRMESAEQEFLTSLQFSDAARTALAERRLSDLGMEPAFIQSLRESRKPPHQIPFHVPSDGFVTDLAVREGTYLQPDMFVLRLASLDPAWIVAEVPESEIGGIAPGGTAEVTAGAHPGRTFSGRIDYIYPEIDPVARTARVRLVVPNKDGALTPNMYVSAKLAEAHSEPVVHVPRNAVIRDGDTARVLLVEGGNRYIQRNVRTGREAGEEIVILDGLSGGDRVVTSAVFLIDSEANLKAGLARLGTHDSASNSSGP